ncbi:PP2C family protein-serine/threonine phosphatase [Sinomonas sp. G460-2]|uniref:PP2C family protein-serine/threonine phosphatase n=1 Tax=Sinomonas sp. G460-2 TaxID=3393464 RepID=UPI0039F0F7CB
MEWMERVHRMALDRRRLGALRGTGILDTPREGRFDRFVEAACALLEAPMAAINFVDADRQWTKAEAGLGGLEQEPLAESMCAHTLEQDATLVVEDASEDPRFAGGRFAADGVRFYAGHPVHAPNGEPIGSLCVMDTQRRSLSGRDRKVLVVLAGLVESEIAYSGELDRAAQVQRMLLPHASPELPGYRIAGRCAPSGSIGGDFFAWQLLQDGTLQIHFADVMGKGIPAALIAASFRAVLMGASRFNDQLTTIRRAAIASQELFEDTESFATLFSARLDPATGGLCYVDAGHGLAAVLGQNGTPRRLRTGGLPIGVKRDDDWGLGEERLRPGETLVVLSDGVLDLFPSIEAALAALARSAPAGDLTPERIVDAAMDHALRHKHSDDVTILALRRTRPPRPTRPGLMPRTRP